MDIVKSLLVAAPLLVVAGWIVAGFLGARLAPRPDTRVWSLPSRTFHWVMAFLVLGNASLMYYSKIYEHRAETDPAALASYRELLARHKSIGLAVLFLLVLRFAWNRYRQRPPLAAGLAPGLRRAAVGTHHLLYLLMLLLPLAGWFASMAAGGRTSFFGLFQMPQLIGKDTEAVFFYFYSHMYLGWLLFGVLTVHISAALWHHFRRRDATLAQMLPFGRR